MLRRSPFATSGPHGTVSARHEGPSLRCHRHGDGGFSLIEMLIVTTILPLVLGALAVGIIAVFRLQSGVSNRLGDSTDAQQISSVYSNDVSGAQYITTAATVSPSTDCAPATNAGAYTRVMGLEINQDTTNGKFGILISYDREAITTKTGTTYNLVRLLCNGEGVTTATSSTILAFDFSPTAVPTISCTPNAPTTLAASSIACSTAIASAGWMSTESVADVVLAVTEPGGGHPFSFTLAASPVNSISSTVTGSPVSNSATAKCNGALPNTGSLSQTLCFVDFSQLNNPAVMAAARSGSCQEMSVAVGNGDTLYFCLAITGTLLEPSVLPTYGQAFLGNSFCLSNLSGVTIPSPYTTSSCLPFYTGIAGQPAFYQTRTQLEIQNGSGPHDNTLTFTGITVENASGQAATGWHIVSADAESTDASSATQGESITWTTNTPLTPICNGEFWDSCTTKNSYGNYDYFGNACLDDQKVPGLTIGTYSITCSGAVSRANEAVTGGAKSGAAMVEATTPNTMTISMSSPYGGLEAVTFGLSVSGAAS